MIYGIVGDGTAFVGRFVTLSRRNWQSRVMMLLYSAIHLIVDRDK